MLPWSSLRAGPLLVSAAAVALLLFGRELALLPIAGANLPSNWLAVPWASPLAFGLAPLAAGALAAELLTFLVPSWYRDRATPAGRARREARHLWAALLLAGAASPVVAHALSAADAMPRLGLVWLFAGAAWTAGTAMLWFLMRGIDRFGLGGGFPVLLLGGAIPRLAASIGQTARNLEQHHTPLVTEGLTAIVLGSMVVATLWVLRAHERPRLGEPAGTSRRLPTAGLIPLDLLALGIAVPASMATFVSPLSPHSLLSLPSPAAGLGLCLAVVTLTGVLLARWPGASLAPRNPEDRAALLRSLLYLALLVIGGHWLARLDIHGKGPPVYALATWTAIGLDLWREWRARKAGLLIAVARPAQLEEADHLMRRLAAAEIPAVLRGAHHRALLRAFGPFVPLEVLVPTGEVERCLGLLVPPPGPPRRN